jgi:hypothetical protein
MDKLPPEDRSVEFLSITIGIGGFTFELLLLCVLSDVYVEAKTATIAIVAMMIRILEDFSLLNIVFPFAG